jgi:hypothetical protein
MTELQHKINLVEQYLYVMGKRNKDGKQIRITFKNQDNTIELEKLQHAYNVAVQYFSR